jgi:hypothetical protein
MSENQADDARLGELAAGMKLSWEARNDGRTVREY